MSFPSETLLTLLAKAIFPLSFMRDAIIIQKQIKNRLNLIVQTNTLCMKETGADNSERRVKFNKEWMIKRKCRQAKYKGKSYARIMVVVNCV